MKHLTLFMFFCISTISVYASPKTNHQAWNEMLTEHVDKTGKVNYKSFKKDQSKLSLYLIELSKNSPDNTWSKSEKMAFYINLYNAYTIKFILIKYPVTSPKNAKFSGKDIWNTKLVKVGKNVYSLKQVEDNILRKMNDPRIHFAINCGALSCPKLANRAFTAENLERLLKNQTILFINDKTHNQISFKKIKISKIFEWYYQDFITDKQSLIGFIAKYSSVSIKPEAKIEYLPYNWNLNE